MRLIVFCLSVLLLFNCEDTDSKKNKTKKPNTTVKKIETPPTDTIVKQEEVTREFPQLGDENAMEFFLQYEKEHKENKVRLITDFGTIEILLFNETKFHRANFIFLTKQHYFDATQFYRVVKNFIVQAGNSDDVETVNKRNYIGKYLLPTDAKRGFTHERGVVSMPSSEIENPHKLASPFEFFIVVPEHGAHHLDGNYTIFGKVTKGMDVVDKISEVETDRAEWPLRNIYIKKVEIIN